MDSCVEGDPSDEDCNGLDDNCDGEIPLDETMDNDLDGIVNCEDLYPDCYFDFYDCAGACGGSSFEDMCGTCDDNPDNDCVQDCAGIWGGPNYLACEICDDDPANDYVCNVPLNPAAMGRK